MNIRAYKDSDYQEVKNILQEGGNFDEVWDGKLHWKKKSEDEQGSILVAEKNGIIMGCVLIIKDQWTCFIFRLAVNKNYRNQGIGGLLLGEAEKKLKEYKAEEIAIFVNEDDDGLQDYYEKRGYIKGGKYRCLYKKL